VANVELLPYHRFGQSKYGFLGQKYELEDFPSLPEQTIIRLRAIVDESFGRKGWSEVNNPLQPPGGATTG
jgi:pyruvate formate lyase activating enzyme